MSQILMVGKPLIMRRWWLKTRPATNAVQINSGEGIPACVEFYVPFWAWPFELLHIILFGSTRLQKTTEE